MAPGRRAVPRYIRGPILWTGQVFPDTEQPHGPRWLSKTWKNISVYPAPGTQLNVLLIDFILEWFWLHSKMEGKGQVNECQPSLFSLPLCLSHTVTRPTSETSLCSSFFSLHGTTNHTHTLTHTRHISPLCILSRCFRDVYT